MSGFLAKSLFASLILAGLAPLAFAQSQTYEPTQRSASFLEGDVPRSAPSFSGLAAAPESAPAAPAAAPAAPDAATAAKDTGADLNKIPDLIATPVATATLPNISPESIGIQKNNDALPADMWKGTSRAVADKLLAALTPTSSQSLNNLIKRLLATAAVPPEGATEGRQSLVASRAEHLVLFGGGAQAWALVRDADPALIDDLTYQIVAENALMRGEDVCTKLPSITRSRNKADWQKTNILCQLRAKDKQAAQVALDVYRAQDTRDAVFTAIADKNIFATAKSLPFQLTPLTSTTASLLLMTGMPLPGELYGRADYALSPVLLRAPCKQDIAQISLGERALERGMIDAAALEDVYRNVKFSDDALITALTSSETGLRLHALLFRASEKETDATRKITMALRFVQSAAPSFVIGANLIAVDMVANIKPEASLSANAATLARIHIFAGKTEAALEWLRVAQNSGTETEERRVSWPYFVLGGMESDSTYSGDLDRWLASAFKPEDSPALRETAAMNVLFLDAAGFSIPETAWSRLLTDLRTEKRSQFSPAVYARLQNAASAGRKAETALLVALLASDKEISLSEALCITRALRMAGFKKEAADFALQQAAQAAKAH